MLACLVGPNDVRLHTAMYRIGGIKRTGPFSVHRPIHAYIAALLRGWSPLGGVYNYSSIAIRLQFDPAKTNRRPTLRPWA